jgi:amidase
MTTDLMLRPAIELASMIRTGEITAVDLLEEAIARYEKFNPTINAVVVTRLELARERAAEADAATARGESWGPLHGVPATIKEAFDWVDTPSTWGNPPWADNVPESRPVPQGDAVAVERLEAAGAIIYGKTNVPLMLGDWQTFNDIYGTTSNPWDLTRVPGGSSGGSAAALATGMSAMEIGSDIGASIRNPAHYCGVFGHKPTFGLVPAAGHMAPGEEVDLDIVVCGPLARSAADLDLALTILAGPSGFDATGYRVDLPPATRTKLSEFKVAVQLDSPVLDTDQEMVDQLQNAVDAMVAAGLQVDDKARPDIDQQAAHDNYMFLLRAATGAMVDDATFEAAAEGSANWHGGDRSYQSLVDHSVRMSHREWFAHHSQRELYRKAWAAFFEDYDLLLCPIASSAAFPHDHELTRGERTITVNGEQQPVVSQLFWAGWSCNVYLPATVAPAGLTVSGLPVGLQIVAPHLHDRRSIRFAQLMEETIGGFVVPPGFE